MKLEYKYNGLIFDITEFIENYISIDREEYINSFAEGNKMKNLISFNDKIKVE